MFNFHEWYIPAGILNNMEKFIKMKIFSWKFVQGGILKTKAQRQHISIVEGIMECDDKSDPWTLHDLSRPFGGYHETTMQDLLQVLKI